MKLLKLSQGKQAIVDDEDYSYLANFKWCVNKKNGYYQVIRTVYDRDSKKYYKIILARVIMDVPCGMLVDHIYHNPLDNRRFNLRVCNHQQNMSNRMPSRNRFKGILKHHGRYRAKIDYNYKRTYLGTFPDPVSAAKAYNDAAIKIFGPFAKLNKI